MNTLELERSLGIGVENEVEETLPEEEVVLNFDSTFAAAKQDLNFLAGMALPDVMQFLFPPMFLAIWDWLKQHIHKTRDFSKLALGIPRGFAKTTLVKIFILYCILFTSRKFILVISSTEDHAINILTDVMSMLGEKNIKTVFGDFQLGMTTDRKNLKIFTFRGREIHLAGIGADGSIRGLNVGHARPDVMIFEDFQKKEDSENLELSQKLLVKMVGTIMKAKAPSGCMYLFIANMYPTPGSILRKLKLNRHWIKFIVGGILADGTSLWEELQPIEQLLEEFQHDCEMGAADTFYAEVLNDEEASNKAGIDISSIPICPYNLSDLPQGKFIVIDPAGDKTTSDMNAVTLHYVYDGYPVFAKLKQNHWSPLELIKQALIMGFDNNCRVIAVEAVAYQSTLLFWFTHVCEQHGIAGFHFVPVMPKSLSKNVRIRDWVKGLIPGPHNEVASYLAPEVRAEVISQIVGWNPVQRVNVDELLDCGAYQQQVVQNYQDLLAADILIDPPEFQQAKVLSDTLTCTF